MLVTLHSDQLQDFLGIKHDSTLRDARLQYKACRYASLTHFIS